MQAKNQFVLIYADGLRLNTFSRVYYMNKHGF